jgi:hypothetical protein
MMRKKNTPLQEIWQKRIRSCSRTHVDIEKQCHEMENIQIPESRGK